MNFSMGRCFLELAQEPSCVALTSHTVGSSTPFGVTVSRPPGSCHYKTGNPCNPENSTLSADKVSGHPQLSHYPQTSMAPSIKVSNCGHSSCCLSFVFIQAPFPTPVLTYLASAGRISSSLLSWCRAVHCTLRPVTP